MSARKDEPPSAFRGVDPPRNFTITAEERIRALTAGPPAYAVRKRRIEDRGEAMLDALLDLYDRLTAKGHRAADVRRAVEGEARAFDLGAYLVYGQRWTPEAPYTVERLLARFAAAIAERA